MAITGTAITIASVTRMMRGPFMALWCGRRPRKFERLTVRRKNVCLSTNRYYSHQDRALAMKTEQFDVVIVGAGLSGIGAARYLKTRLPNKSFVIFETKP